MGTVLFNLFYDFPLGVKFRKLRMVYRVDICIKHNMTLLVTFYFVPGASYHVSFLQFTLPLHLYHSNNFCIIGYKQICTNVNLESINNSTNETRQNIYGGNRIRYTILKNLIFVGVLAKISDVER